MRVGIYVRVSKSSSDNDNQLLVLRDYCGKMGYEIYKEYEDVVGGAKENRPAFSSMMNDASKRKFDMLLFFALDRFSRAGTRQTIHFLQQLDDYGVSYRSYSEQYIDSSGIFKDVIISLLSTLSKQERIRISERVLAALAKSRSLGRVGGRPKLDKTMVEKIKKLHDTGISKVDIAKKLGVSRSSVYQYL